MSRDGRALYILPLDAHHPQLLHAAHHLVGQPVGQAVELQFALTVVVLIRLVDPDPCHHQATEQYNGSKADIERGGFYLRASIGEPVNDTEGVAQGGNDGGGDKDPIVSPRFGTTKKTYA